jgi:hypothetical protein
MAGIAQPVQQRATGLTTRFQFSSFSFVLYSYVLLTSLCINIFAFCINVTHSVFCTTYVLLFTYCSLFM